MVQSRWRDMARMLFALAIYCMYIIGIAHGLRAPSVDDFQSLSVPEPDPRDLAGLAEKWNLTSDGVTFSGMEFRLDFIVSDFILDSMIDAVAYTAPGCKDDGGAVIPVEDLAYTLGFDNTPPGSGDFERSIWVDAVATPEKVDSLVYKTIYNEEGEKFAEVEFCIRMSLYTSTSTPIEVNYLESIVKFTADLTAGFDVEAINVSPKEKLTATAVQEYEVDAYLCDELDERLTGSSLTNARTQGEIIRVCVTPNEDARRSDIYMRAIQEYSWFRDYGGALGMVTQIAIQDSQEADNFLTALFCTRGSSICAFESLLFANFYVTPGMVSGTGTAFLQIGNSTGESAQRRELRGASVDRALQSSNDIPATDFDISYELRMGDEAPELLKTSASSSTSGVVFPFVVIGMITLLHLALQ